MFGTPKRGLRIVGGKRLVSLRPNLSIAEQDESIIQFYRNLATPKQIYSSKADNKTEPNGRAMSKVITMFN